MDKLEWTPVSRELNAWHYDEHPDYWQWLYFDFVFDNGYSAAAVILPRSIGSISGVSLPGLTPEVWLTVLTPEGKRYDVKKAYPLADCRGDRKGLNVAVGKNLLRFDGGRYQVNLSEGGIGMELDLSPLLPPWTPLDEKGYANPSFLQALDPSGSPYFNYIEFVPRGEVKGSLILEGKKIPVSGLGYHEQGRGNLPPLKFFQHWYWLKFWLDEFTFISPSGLTVPELSSINMTCALLARGRDKILDYIDYNPDDEIVKSSDFRIEPETQTEYPARMEFELVKDRVAVAGSLQTGPLVEAFNYNYPSRPVDTPPAYLRFLAELELNLDIDGEKIRKNGPGMQEIMTTGGKAES